MMHDAQLLTAVHELGSAVSGALDNHGIEHRRDSDGHAPGEAWEWIEVDTAESATVLLCAIHIRPDEQHVTADIDLRDDDGDPLMSYGSIRIVDPTADLVAFAIRGALALISEGQNLAAAER